MKNPLTGIRAVAFMVLVAECFMPAMPAAAQSCEVKIGMAGPMTGGASAWGLAVRAGTEFAAAMTNEAGGLSVGAAKCVVKVLTFDAQGTPAGGAAASNYFATQNVHVVIGPIISSETEGFKPVAKRNGQINFSTSFSSNVIGPEFPLAFHQLQSPPTWGPLIIKQAKLRFHFSSVVIIGPNDQGGTDSGKALVKLYADAGVRPTEEYYLRGITNFAPMVTRVMSSNPDAVEIAAMGPGDSAIFLKQLLEAGYSGTIGKLASGASSAIQGAGGAGNLKAFYWVEHAPLDDPGIVRFRADFERVMKFETPDISNLYTSTFATEQVLRAISLAGTDQDVEKIATELRDTIPDSPYVGKAGWRGKAQYGINQELSFPVAMGIIENGKREPMQRIDIPSE